MAKGFPIIEIFRYLLSWLSTSFPADAEDELISGYSRLFLIIFLYLTLPCRQERPAKRYLPFPYIAPVNSFGSELRMILGSGILYMPFYSNIVFHSRRR